MKYGSKANLSAKSCSDIPELVENSKLLKCKKLSSNLVESPSLFHWLLQGGAVGSSIMQFEKHCPIWSVHRKQRIIDVCLFIFFFSFTYFLLLLIVIIIISFCILFLQKATRHVNSNHARNIKEQIILM